MKTRIFMVNVIQKVSLSVVFNSLEDVFNGFLIKFIALGHTEKIIDNIFS